MSRTAKRGPKRKRPSKSLATVRNIEQRHCWLAMLTFKPMDSDCAARSNGHQRFLLNLLRRELRADKTGFLVVREFGSGSSQDDGRNRTHFHVIFTKALAPERVRRLQAALLRRCGEENNQRKIVDYRTHNQEGEPRFGSYVTKFKKGNTDLIKPPQGWPHGKLLRFYHSGFLSNCSLR